MNEKEKIIVALTSVISVLESIGCASIFNDLELKDGTKIKIDCVEEIKNYIDTNLSCENYEFEGLKELNNAIDHCNNVIKELKNKPNCDGCLKDHQQLKKWLIRYKNIINPSHYKFEDLKPNMWVYDITWNVPRQIKYLKQDTKELQFYDCDYREKFEDNILYPITKAIQNEVEYNG